jgi:predicted molibdopterin-dependent oxidoreductase YjgC
MRDRTAQGAGRLRQAKGSNEEAYLFQKLVRTGFGSNNVDHCTRLCHASSWRRCSRASAPARCQQPGQ